MLWHEKTREYGKKLYMPGRAPCRTPYTPWVSVQAVAWGPPAQAQRSIGTEMFSCQSYKYVFISLNGGGQCHEIFCFGLFSWIIFPHENNIRVIVNFFENFRRKSRCTTNINNTGSKFCHWCCLYQWQFCYWCHLFQQQICRRCQQQLWQIMRPNIRLLSP